MNLDFNLKKGELSLEKSHFKSDNPNNKYKKSVINKQNKQNKKNRIKKHSSLFSRCIDLDFKEINEGFNSVKPLKIDFDKTKNRTNNFKNEKFTFNIETINNEGYTDIQNLVNLKKTSFKKF